MWISIDLYEQVVTAYQDDKPIFATLASTGMERWPTKEGLFHIYYRHLREHMSGGNPGDDFYYLEEVPWTMFLTRDARYMAPIGMMVSAIAGVTSV